MFVEHDDDQKEKERGAKRSDLRFSVEEEKVKEGGVEERSKDVLEDKKMKMRKKVR